MLDHKSRWCCACGHGGMVTDEHCCRLSGKRAQSHPVDLAIYMNLYTCSPYNSPQQRCQQQGKLKDAA